MILGLHHPAIVVPNLQHAIKFYCDALEFELCNTEEWHAPNAVFDQITGLENSAAKFALLKTKNCYLELFEFKFNVADVEAVPKDAAHLGIRHLAFLVEDVSLALEKLLTNGGQKMNEPATVENIITAVYCRDPFDNIIELRTDTKPLPPVLTSNLS